MTQPQAGFEIRYAKSGEVNIAYAAIGGGDLDLLFVPGFISHLEIGGELPQVQRLAEFEARAAGVNQASAIGMRPHSRRAM